MTNSKCLIISIGQLSTLISYELFNISNVLNNVQIINAILAAIAIPENGVGDFSQQNVIKASKDSHTTTTTGLIESCDREDNVSLLSAIGNKRGFRC